MARSQRKGRHSPLRRRTAARAGSHISAASVTSTASPEAERLTCSVIYVHGVGRQDPPLEARLSWDTALFGQTMSDTDMAYWADIRRPVAGGTAPRALRRADRGLASAAAQDYMLTLQRVLEARVRRAAPGATAQGKVLGWLPGVGDKLLEWLTKGFIRDTAAYFFDTSQRNAMQQRLIDVLDRHSGRPIILIAHSQGTIIAYDVLRRLAGQAPSGRALRVELLVTLGSPLGIDEIQSRLTKPLMVPKGVEAWANFADLLDPVALDKGLAGEFKGDVAIRDTLVRNAAPFNPHSSVGYLATGEVHSRVYSVLNWNPLRYGSRVRKDVLADMVRTLAERELGGEPGPEERHAVLIELRDKAAFGESATRDLDETAKEEVKTLAEHRAMVAKFLEANVANKKDAAIDPLHRYVAARLSPSEIQRVETKCRASVYCVWKNTRKRALISRSADVVQVPAARVAYRADGEGVTWAVLDTGVERSHPHFQVGAGKHPTIARVWDCTQPGPVTSLTKARRGAADPQGHGTHVCGIIAGGLEASGKPGPHAGLAPKAELHVYKVLDADGSGEDGWIIKAIDHITEVNNASADLAIHGVNLSLGGAFNPEVYGCGHSPICQELRLLWRQGLVVCVACGNEGAVDVSTPEGTQTLNTFLSIGDPANLDECIAVGSVHADRPHSYGVSYFSSRGPTADGRSKPDVVAPGEHISSCNARCTSGDPESHYVALSGTSMATPHVSGLVAAFLSVRREFIGRPDDVKRLLLANCTDLARDKYLQGAGIPNLVKMLANT